MRYIHQIRIRTASLLIIISLIAIILTACSPSLTLETQFQSELEALQEQFQFPGATASYILNDGTAKAFAVGLSDIENETPMKPESRMLAASIGKTFVGATVLALMQEGLLNLDEPISKWLGDRSWFSRLANHETITLRQLLNHTSGIPNHVENEDFLKSWQEKRLASSNPFTPEELIAFVLDSPPIFKPGEGWYYTDTGYLLLGLIIEIITEHSYYDEVTQRFLKPLNLTLTTPSDRLELPGLAPGYMVSDNVFGLPPKSTVSPSLMAWHPGIEWTGGGLISNSKDLAIWGKALFEGNAIEGNYLSDLLQSVPISPENSDTQYGISVGIYENGPHGATYGHGGWIPGYSSSLRYYPTYKVAIAFQINTDIGVIDHSSNVIEDIESRLAEVVIATLRK